MAAYLPGYFNQQFFYNGAVAAGQVLYVYETGTSTPKTVYTDQGGTIPYTQPIVLNASGKPEDGPFWILSGECEIRHYTAPTPGGALVDTFIDVGGIASSGDLAQIVADYAASSGSAGIGHVSDIPGAIPTTAQEVLRERVNLFDMLQPAEKLAVKTSSYGPITSLHTSLNAGITALYATGRRVNLWMRDGDWRLTSPLQLPYGIGISGASAVGAMFNCYDCNAIEFITYGTSIGVVVLENFGMTVASGVDRTAIKTAANASTMDGIRFQDLRFYGWDTCIDLAANWDCFIERCAGENINTAVKTSGVVMGLTIRENRFVLASGGAGSSTKVGLNLMGGTSIETIRIEQNKIVGFDVDIRVEQALYLTIIGNDLNAQVIGVDFTTPNGTYTIERNYVETAGIGIKGQAQGVDTPLTKSNIHKNEILGISGSTVGIELNTAVATYQFNCDIDENTVRGFDTHDIRLFSPGRSRVTENKCLSTVPRDSIWVGGVISPPVAIDGNECTGLVYIDNLADIASGSLILRENTQMGEYKALRQSATPTTGTWTVGYDDFVENTAKTSGGYLGFALTASGTLGTLNGGATTGGITIGTTSLTVNSVTGLKRGHYIAVAGAITSARVLAIVGLVLTLDAAASATVAGAAVSFKAPTFKNAGLIA